MNPALPNAGLGMRRKSGVRALFVTGTDTGVGKTIVTGCLARYLLEKGHNVITQKWIQTGCGSIFSSDIRVHFKLMGRDIDSAKEYFPYIAPYIFEHASSPHFSCRIENKIIDANKIIKSFKLLASEFDFVIVEGVGGALVPFNRKRLVIDIVKGLDLPVLVVAENRLGAINHTLLTLESLASRKIKALGLVFNNLKEKNKFILKDNPEIIKALTGQRVFGILPHQASYQKIYESFVPIGKKISGVLKING